MGEMSPWSPWRHLRDNWPQFTVYEYDLPDGVLGCTNYRDAIWLDHRLNQAERRCTLAHELGHLERGPLHPDATQAMLDAEEIAVDQWAARKLITSRDFIAAFSWSLDLHEMAEELWVDVPTLRARIRVGTDEEQDAVMAAIARRHQAA